jgi:SAM-dependent methyltransferase
MSALLEQFGHIDIYLFDQLLRGRISPGMRIFDAGCGTGRNLVYFLRHSFEVFGVDPDAHSIQRTRQLAFSLSAQVAADNFRIEAVESTTFPASFADVVLSSAVLHFARDQAHFDAMLQGTWRVLKPGGLFFCRLASSIGMQSRDLTPLDDGRRFRLPDASDRYLVDEQTIMHITQRWGARLLDPLKTTIVQDERCMTTWVLRK